MIRMKISMPILIFLMLTLADCQVNFITQRRVVTQNLTPPPQSSEVKNFSGTMNDNFFNNFFQQAGFGNLFNNPSAPAPSQGIFNTTIVNTTTTPDGQVITTTTTTIRRSGGAADNANLSVSPGNASIGKTSNIQPVINNGNQLDTNNINLNSIISRKNLVPQTSQVITAFPQRIITTNTQTDTSSVLPPTGSGQRAQTAADLLQQLMKNLKTNTNTNFNQITTTNQVPIPTPTPTPTPVPTPVPNPVSTPQTVPKITTSSTVVDLGPKDSGSKTTTTSSTTTTTSGLPGSTTTRTVTTNSSSTTANGSSDSSSRTNSTRQVIITNTSNSSSKNINLDDFNVNNLDELLKLLNENTIISGSQDTKTPTAPAPPSDPSQFSKKSQLQLQRHNLYRKKHNAPPLVLSAWLTKRAQQYAQQLAKMNVLMHSNTTLDGKRIGQNLYMSLPPPVAGDATDAWYNQIKSYDFNKQGFKPDTGHFTQVVWKDTKEVGFGYAGGYVVANYYPAGNFIGRFQQNVFKAAS